MGQSLKLPLNNWEIGWLRSVAAFFESILSATINGIVSLNTSFIFSYSKIKDYDIEIIAVRS